jgi:hypothetical protein
MPNHSSASLVKFYRPEFQAQIAMNIIREYLGYPAVGGFVVLISVNKFPLQGLFRHAWMHVTRRITRRAEHNQYDAAVGQDVCYPYALISRIRVIRCVKREVKQST